MCFVQHLHMDNPDSSDEIQLVERCKRRAEDDELPLRQIFDDVCRSAVGSGQLSFRHMENSMYKRRRRALPALPTCLRRPTQPYVGVFTLN